MASKRNLLLIHKDGLGGCEIFSHTQELMRKGVYAEFQMEQVNFVDPFTATKGKRIRTTGRFGEIQSNVTDKGPDWTNSTRRAMRAGYFDSVIKDDDDV